MSGTKVEAPSENPLGPCPGVLFGDPSTVSAGVIVIQEWWGMNQQILDTAKEITERTQIVTLVPDLYRGKVAKDRETAGHYMQDLDWTGAVSDVDGFARFLKSQGVKKVGVTGFCLGGAISLAVVATRDAIDASVPFYGIPRPGTIAWDCAKIKVPVQCHFGEKDEVKGFSTPADYEPLRVQLKEAGVNVEFYTYDAGHGFTNKQNPNFSNEARELSFSRMFQFFAKYLK